MTRTQGGGGLQSFSSDSSRRSCLLGKVAFSSRSEPRVLEVQHEG